jgi:hypothetical protein
MIPSLPFYFFNKKAISRLLSEFLLIIISLSIVFLAGLFLNAYSKSLSYNPKIEIIEARAISWAGGILIKVNVANVGNVNLTLTSVSINFPKKIENILSKQESLGTSQTKEVEEYIPQNEIGNYFYQPPSIGTKLTIIASANDPNGKTIQVIKNVEVMP